MKKINEYINLLRTLMRSSGLVANRRQLGLVNFELKHILKESNLSVVYPFCGTDLSLNMLDPQEII